MWEAAVYQPKISFFLPRHPGLVCPRARGAGAAAGRGRAAGGGRWGRSAEPAERRPWGSTAPPEHTQAQGAEQPPPARSSAGTSFRAPRRPLCPTGAVTSRSPQRRGQGRPRPLERESPRLSPGARHRRSPQAGGADAALGGGPAGSRLRPPADRHLRGAGLARRPGCPSAASGLLPPRPPPQPRRPTPPLTFAGLEEDGVGDDVLQLHGPGRRRRLRAAPLRSARAPPPRRAPPTRAQPANACPCSSRAAFSLVQPPRKPRLLQRVDALPLAPRRAGVWEGGAGKEKYASFGGHWRSPAGKRERVLIGGRGVTQGAQPPLREPIGRAPTAPTSARGPPSAASDWVWSCHSAADWVVIGVFGRGGVGPSVCL